MTQINLTPLMVGGQRSGLVANVQVPDGLVIMEDGQDVPKTHGLFRILTAEDGDKRVVWNRMSVNEIREAEEMFNNLVAEGMVPYEVGPNGGRGGVMAEFDPIAEEILFAPLQYARAG